jgi:regulatory protein
MKHVDGPQRRPDELLPGPRDPLQQARSWLADRGVDPPIGVTPEDRVQVGDPPDGSSGADATGAPPEPGDPSDARDQARSIVLRKLAASARTREELSKSLRARDIPAAVADEVLDRMETVGLLDDGRFAQNWVDSRQQRRHLSGAALRRELNTKGVAPETIDAALSKVDPDAEYRSAEALARKRLRGMATLPRDVQYRRVAAALMRRGFGTAVSARVLAEVLSPGQEDTAGEGL